MTGNKELLFEYEKKIGGGTLTFGDNRKGQIKGYDVILRRYVDINKMAYVNGLKHNLISVSQLYDNGLDVKFNINLYALLKEDTTTEMMRTSRKGDLYLLNFTTSNKEEKVCLVASTSEVV